MEHLVRADHLPTHVNSIIAEYAGNGKIETRAVVVMTTGDFSKGPTRVDTGHHALYSKHEISMETSVVFLKQLFYLGYHATSDELFFSTLRLPDGKPLDTVSTLAEAIAYLRTRGGCFKPDQPLTLWLVDDDGTVEKIHMCITKHMHATQKTADGRGRYISHVSHSTYTYDRFPFKRGPVGSTVPHKSSCPENADRRERAVLKTV